MTKRTQFSLQQKYGQQLGMNVSGALRKLGRKFLFSLARRLDMTTCCRCGQLIDDWTDMSLDHLEPWINQPNASELFWDLDNVKLSHKICNVREAAERKRMSPEEKKVGARKQSKRWADKQRALHPITFRKKQAAASRRWADKQRALNPVAFRRKQAAASRRSWRKNRKTTGAPQKVIFGDYDPLPLVYSEQFLREQGIENVQSLGAEGLRIRTENFGALGR